MRTPISKQESQCLRRFLEAGEAVSALEYAILVGVVAVALGAAIVTFSDTLADTLTNMATELPNISIKTDAGKDIKAAT